MALLSIIYIDPKEAEETKKDSQENICKQLRNQGAEATYWN